MMIFCSCYRLLGDIFGESIDDDWLTISVKNNTSESIQYNDDIINANDSIVLAVVQYNEENENTNARKQLDKFLNNTMPDTVVVRNSANNKAIYFYKHNSKSSGKDIFDIRYWQITEDYGKPYVERQYSSFEINENDF
ncbi:MAG: hypothetical protein IJ681_07245 [Bacteroidales bacterium]|nr:hypothetical protein [Bacteroidales bacterium]